MNKEDKQLLLTDLCGRLPHGIYVYHEDYCEDNPEKLDTIHYDSQLGDYGFQCCVDDMDEGYHSIEKIKPYLRPMSSMTKEEEETECYLRTYQARRYADFCNSKHLDYRGLIEKGLAIEAPEGMYKLKQ